MSNPKKLVDAFEDDDFIDDAPSGAADDDFDGGPKRPSKAEAKAKAKASVDASGNFVINMDADVDEAAADGPPPIAPGVYILLVDDLEYKLSSKGNWMYTWKFRVIAGDEDDADGRIIYDYHTLFNLTGKNPGIDERNMARTKKYLKALGVDIDYTRFNPAEVAESGAAIGLRARAKIGIQKGNDNQKRNNIQSLLPIKSEDDF